MFKCHSSLWLYTTNRMKEKWKINYIAERIVEKSWGCHLLKSIVYPEPKNKHKKVIESKRILEIGHFYEGWQRCRKCWFVAFEDVDFMMRCRQFHVQSAGHLINIRIINITDNLGGTTEVGNQRLLTTKICPIKPAYSSLDCRTIWYLCFSAEFPQTDSTKVILSAMEGMI